MSIVCITCGIEFAPPEHYESARREDGRTFYCPNGHELSYPAQPTRRELKDKIANLESSRASWMSRATSSERLVHTLQTMLRTCPFCGVPFRGRQAMHKHLVAFHEAQPRTIKAITAPAPKQIGSGS